MVFGRGGNVLAGVLLLPMLANGVGDFDQPRTVFGHFQNIRRGKILGGILRRIAERLEQPGIDQRGNVVRLAVQHPARLLRREAGGQLPQERQEPLLIFFHRNTSRPRAQNRTAENNCTQERQTLGFSGQAMDDLIKLVRTYRADGGTGGAAPAGGRNLPPD